MSQSRHQLSAAGLPCCSRRSFLQWSTVAGLPVVLGNTEALAGDSSREDVPAGIDLESLRQDIGDGPEVLVSRAVAAGWRVVCDETVLKRPEAWQRDLAVALERNRVELSAIEAVVDFGRVTFASSSPVVRAFTPLSWVVSLPSRRSRPGIAGRPRLLCSLGLSPATAWPSSGVSCKLGVQSSSVEAASSVGPRE